MVNTLRKIRNENSSKLHLPWMQINNDFNWKLLNKNQPRTYWVKKEQVTKQLETIGFLY